MAFEETPLHQQIARNVIADLDADAFGQSRENLGTLRAYLRGRPLLVGSMYSGTDLAFSVLQEYLSCLGGDDIALQQRMACEWIEWKRAFIRANHPGLISLFGNAKELGEAEAYCHIAEERVSIPSVDLLTVGFSCKNFSALRAPEEQQWSTAILEGGGSSGACTPHRSSSPLSPPSLSSSSSSMHLQQHQHRSSSSSSSSSSPSSSSSSSSSTSHHETTATTIIIAIIIITSASSASSASSSSSSSSSSLPSSSSPPSSSSSSLLHQSLTISESDYESSINHPCRTYQLRPFRPILVSPPPQNPPQNTKMGSRK